MNVHLVAQADIDAIWPLVYERIIQCAEEQDTDCDPADIYARCRAGTAFLIVATNEDSVVGFSISVFEKWTRGTVFNILIMAGSRMRDWRDEMEKLGVSLAKFGGASRIAWQGRKGWERSQPKARIAGVRMVMEI